MKTVLNKVFSIATLIFVLSISLAKAQSIGDFRSRDNGDWDNIAIWSRFNGTGFVNATTGQLPTSSSNVQISDGHKVNFNLSSLTINTLTIEAGSTDSDLEILSTNSLTVTGAISIGAGSGNNDTKFLLVNAGNVSCSSLTLATTGNDNRDVQVKISTGTLNVSGNVTMNGNSDRNEISFSSTGLLNLGGSITGGILNTNVGTRGTVNYNGSSAQTINLAYVYNNLKINNTNASGASISAAITATNVVGTITVGDVNTGSLFTTANNTITRGDSKTILVSSGSTMNAGATNITFGTTGTMTINGTFIFTDAQGLTGTNAAIINSSTLTLGLNSTIDYAGANQSISNLSYKNLKLSGSGLKTFAGASNMAGDMYVETGVRVNPFAGTVHSARSLALGGVGKAIGTYGGFQSTATSVIKNTTFFGSDAASSSDGAISATALSPLPVTLTSFTAKPTSTNTVALNWATASEIVNKGFRIERQAGGVNGKFESLGFVASKANGGNSQTALYYNFIDASPRSGATAYYRLAQEDLDGKTTFSEVRVVKLNGETVSMVFPNPSNGAVNISRTANGKKMNVQVIDMAGRMIQQFTNITDSNFKLNINKSGIYNIKMSYPETGEQSVQRIVIER